MNVKMDPNPVAWRVEISGRPWTSRVVRRKDVALEDAAKLQDAHGEPVSVSPLFALDPEAQQFFMGQLMGTGGDAKIVRSLEDAARAALPFIAFAYAHGVDGAEQAGRDLELAIASHGYDKRRAKGPN